MSSTNDEVEHFDVLIAGGGPVGATLAGYLGRSGIKTLLVEAGDGVVHDCRMHLVNIRSMEILRNLDLEQEMRNCGWPQDYMQDIVFVTHLDGRELARVPWPAISEMDAPDYSPTFAQRCPQAWFNPIVLAFAERQASTTLRYHTRLENFSADKSGVTVELVGADGERSTVRTKYLIGCDGPRSTVRKVLGVMREGTDILGQSVEVVFKAPDLAERLSMGKAGRFVMVSKRGLSSNVIPFDGIDRYRMSMLVKPSEMTLDQMEEEIRSLTLEPFDFEIVTPLLPWVNRAVSATTYVVGRVVLAGDAAHSVPPTGGFGMNSGIQDVYDLGWRLKALIKGWGGPALLESYDVERRAAMARAGEMAAAIYNDWVEWYPKLQELGPKLEEEGAEADELRANLGKQLYQTFRREFNVQGVPLGYRYLNSPIVIRDGSPEPQDSWEDYTPIVRPGHRAPHMWLEDGRSTLDLFGEMFTLLVMDDSDDILDWQECAERLSVPLQVIRPETPRAWDIFGSGKVLVRPDGVVSWRSDGAQETIEDVLLTVTGRANHMLAELALAS